MRKTNVTIPNATLKRLPIYLRYLREKEQSGEEFISSVTIAEHLELNSVQVKKDISLVSSVDGKPRVGFDLKLLIKDFENFLCCDDEQKACLVGVGQMGSALLSYKGFTKYGLDIVAGFDIKEELFGKVINGAEIYPMTELKKIIREKKVVMAILAVHVEHAQSVCDELVEAGVQGILNFASVTLKVPSNVIVQSIDVASSLAILSTKIKFKDN